MVWTQIEWVPITEEFQPNEVTRHLFDSVDIHLEGKILRVNSVENIPVLHCPANSTTILTVWSTTSLCHLLENSQMTRNDSCGKDADFACSENAPGVSHFPIAAAAPS